MPGATVTLLVNRSGVDHHIGAKTVTNSKDSIPLDATEELIAGDYVNAFQELGSAISSRSNDGPQVQTSIAEFHAPQILTHLYQCSRGFILGGMRPGTHIEILQGGSVIGTGIAIDGTAAISVSTSPPN